MAKASTSKATKTAQQAEQDDNFALRSLQETLEKEKRFKPSDEQLMHFYEQMLLIRRFEEKAGQL